MALDGGKESGWIVWIRGCEWVGGWVGVSEEGGYGTGRHLHTESSTVTAPGACACCSMAVRKQEGGVSMSVCPSVPSPVVTERVKE